MFRLESKFDAPDQAFGRRAKQAMSIPGIRQKDERERFSPLQRAF